MLEISGSCFSCASNTRIRCFFPFCTFFWGCILYAGASYMCKDTVVYYNTCTICIRYQHDIFIDILYTCLFENTDISNHPGDSYSQTFILILTLDWENNDKVQKVKKIKVVYQAGVW